MSTTNTITETERRKINLIADKYADAVDRLLKLQIARTREETKAAKFALFAAAADSESERIRLTGYSIGSAGSAAETAAELTDAARALLALVWEMDAYGLHADPEILCMAYHITRANH